MSTVWLIVVVIAALSLAETWMFNTLIRRRTRTLQAWAQIDVELKRRHDLIPNLLEVVHGYAGQERSTMEAVTAARTAAVTAARTGDPATITDAEHTLGTALGSLFALCENYPALRAVESFLRLQEHLLITEDKLESARRHYNVSTRDYNAAIATFPHNLTATLFGFHPTEYFPSDPADSAAPVLDLAVPVTPNRHRQFSAAKSAL